MASRNLFNLLADVEEDGGMKQKASKPAAAPAAKPAAAPAKAAAPAAAPAKTSSTPAAKAAAPAAAAPAAAPAKTSSTPAAKTSSTPAASSAPKSSESSAPRDARPPRSDKPRPEGERAPRPPRAEGERPPRPPRAEGERPAKPEGERAPRPEGERPPRAPRAEGDRPPRPPRAEGERPPRPPRAEGDRPPRPPRQPRAEGEAPAEGAAATEGASAPRKYRSDEADPRGKRQFDRRHGQHKTSSESKKGGAGAHSWGVEGEEAQAEPKHLSKNETVDKAAPSADPVADEPAAPPAPEEPKYLSLQEIMQQRQEKALAVEKKIRKAGEGESSSWDDAVLKTRTELAEFLPVTKKDESKEKKETKPAAPSKVLANDLLNMSLPQRRDDRPDRPRYRSDKGRGPAPARQALVFDEAAFPALKAK